MTSNQKSSLSKAIYQSMKVKETAELRKIWVDNDRLEWSDEAFEAIRVILLERVGEVPPQATSRSTKKRRKTVSKSRKSSLSILLLIATFFTVIILINPRIGPNPLAVVEATSTPRPITEITAFPSTLKIDNIDIEFSGYKVEKDSFIITICFRSPTQERWTFENTVFSINSGIIEESWTSTDSNPGRPDGFYCGDLAYPITSIPRAGKAKLSIGQLKTYNMGDCSKAQKNLDRAKIGIVITCDPDKVNNTWGFVILKKPLSMSEGEAFFKVQEAFSDTLQVNWRFSFVIERP